MREDKYIRGVDSKVWKKFAAFCASTGRNQGEILSEALEDFLQKIKFDLTYSIEEKEDKYGTKRTKGKTHK